MSNIKHLVLSGGGLLGISYIGLIKYFEEHNVLYKLKSITGCSAGAIFGSLLAIGYTSKELEKITKSMIFKDYLKINVDSILNFTNTKGFESGKNLNIFIKKCIQDKTGDENITFSQVQDKYNIKLQIGVTNLTKSKFELFNKDTTPDISIEKAISASIALPFIFEPIVIGDDIYCDGGLLDNLPIDSLIDKDDKDDKDNKDNKDNNTDDNINISNKEVINDDKDDKKVINDDKDDKKVINDDKDIINLEISKKELYDKSISIIGFYLINKSKIINKDNYKLINLSQYINLMTHTLSRNIINKKIQDDKTHKYKIIIIEIPADIMTFIKLNATHDDIDNIINIAYNITKNDLKLNKN
jgi:predicted acylesterase/phospholipase RssA